MSDPSAAVPVLDGVRAVVLHRVRLPLREPFVAAHGVEHDREVVLVEVAGDEGVSGWGECVALSKPTYTAEYTDGAWRVLRDDLVPAVLRGVRPDTQDCPMAWTALDGALTDRVLRRRGVSLATSIGGTRVTVACTAVVGGQPDIDILVARVATRRDEGYASVKVKIAPGADVEPLRVLRGTFPDLSLAADANGSYRPGDRTHDDALRALDRLGLWYLEQPLAPAHAADLVGLAAAMDTLIVLDESIVGPDDVRAFVAMGAAFGVNCKPGRVGGLARAMACVTLAADAGWPVFVGGMLETGVGRAFALATASLPGCILPTDLGPSARYFADDLTQPFELADGCLTVPTGSGLGVTPRPRRLAEATVAHVEVVR